VEVEPVPAPIATTAPAAPAPQHILPAPVQMEQEAELPRRKNFKNIEEAHIPSAEVAQAKRSSMSV
jgi:transcription termination factor Rho